jgi:adenylate cyclase
MSIRKKIFLLAGILLALFGVVVGTLAVMQKMDGEQISNIVAYEQPLSRSVSEFDVDTDRYEPTSCACSGCRRSGRTTCRRWQAPSRH